MMNSRKKGGLKPLTAAVGLGLAMVAGSASADINWGSPFTLFEDDNVDFHFDAQGNIKQNGLLEVGDVLSAVLELNTANGAVITPPELTGLAIVELVARVDVNGNGQLDDIFAPASLGFDFFSNVLGATGAPLANGAGAAGSGAMVAFWLDNSEDLTIDAGSVVGGTTSCTTYAGCVGQATNGDEWLVAGFTGDADEVWIVLDAPSDVSGIDGALPSEEFGALNAGLGVITNSTGRDIRDISCGSFCGPGGDGLVDISASGSIKGGGESFTQSEWFATSDFDMLINAVPVPGSLLLMGVGLLGLGGLSRRRKV